MKHIIAPVILCATSLFAVAGPTSSESDLIDVPMSDDHWDFRLQPYGWLTAIDGTTGPQAFPAEIDASFSDIFEVLEMAAALQFEARKGRWGVIADVFYAELGNSGTLPGLLETQVDLDFEQLLAEFVVFYRVSDSPRSFVDLYAGVRHMSLSMDLEATRTGTLLAVGARRSGDADWTDPIIGVRSQWDINDRWFLAAKGDLGGFGVDSDLTWNLQASVGYRFNESVSIEVGYRYFDTDYSGGGFSYDVAQAGALVGLNFEF